MKYLSLKDSWTKGHPILKVEIMIWVMWKLITEHRSVVCFHSLQKVFSVDVNTARTFTGLGKTQYRLKFEWMIEKFFVYILKKSPNYFKFQESVFYLREFL